MEDYYTEEIIKMLGAMSHNTIKRIYYFILRLYKKELGG